MRYWEYAGQLMENDDVGRVDADKDSRALQLDDTRKPKLTLRMVNRLKKIRATKNLENTKKADLLNVMYGGSPGDDEM